LSVLAEEITHSELLEPCARLQLAQQGSLRILEPSGDITIGLRAERQ
jgi:hypothetical protein